jgi:hypothetical protein
MGRRLTGVAVLVLAIVAAVVVGGFHTKQVRGAPTTAPPPDPPAAGACLGNLAGYGYPFYASEVPCDRAHVGEVVEVMPAGALARATSTADSTNDDRDPSIACQQSVIRYLGVADGSTWLPSAPVAAYLIEPDPIAAQLGSDWLLCAAGVEGADVGQGAYNGTLRDAMRTGRFPPSFAVCPVSLEHTSSSQTCTAEHSVEAFGVTTVGDTGQLPELTASCATLVTSMTGLADPTAGGRLTVALAPQVSIVATQPAGRAAGTQTVNVSADIYVCLVHTTGSEQLTGPLLGLHGGRLPLT